MDVRLLFPSLYFSYQDFVGKEVTLTIRRVAKERLRTERGEEEKWVIYFEEVHEKATKAGVPDKQKRLVMGKTCGIDIGAAVGWEMETWPGKRVTLYAGKAKGGKDCTRAKPAPAKAGPVEVSEAHAIASDVPEGVA